MSTFFWTCVGRIALALLSLRYRITFKGLENLSSEKLNRKGGILFLPNHPALMDPLFLFLRFWPSFRMRPLSIEYIYRTAILRPFMKLTKAVSVPNFDTSINQLKIKKAEESLETIIKGLKKRENFIFWPAGKLKNAGKEILAGVSGVHAILQKCPNANVVLIRTTGLWGSSFSRAFEGRSPNLNKVLWHGIKTVLKNFVLFVPRRKVLVEIESNPADLPLESKQDLNRALEVWYNCYLAEDGVTISETEPLKLVSYSCFYRDVPRFSEKKQREKGKNISIPDPIRKKIYSEILHILKQPDLKIEPQMRLDIDLGMDSLNIAELMAFIYKNFHIKDLHPEDFETVSSTLEVAAGFREEERSRETKTKFYWPHENRKRLPPALPVGSTIPEAFLNSCQRMGSSIACGDDLVGSLTYKRLKTTALVLAQKFRKIQGSHVGVLLPSSVGAYIVILALQLARKVPVMLNWTLGPRYLDQMMEQSGAKVAISSWRFLDRASHIELGDLLDKILLLEDLKMELSIKEKLYGAFLAHCSVGHILCSLGLDRIDPNDPAVILFTSGTEANPKGVLLSHHNIISNQRAAMQCLEWKSNYILYGVLPPFHSFGFSVVGIFPLLAGLKVAFYPDPTDSFALAEGIERWQITLFCSAPSFMKGLFHVAKKEQLRSVQYFVVGAEKSPPEIAKYVKQLGTKALLLEGYGITECSPIISIVSPNVPAKGVGRPLPNIALCTIHPETHKLLPEGEEGEICVQGPSVFNGYLGNPRTPFIQINGSRWYRTGDLGYLDKEGNLILSGRLKRFTKFGGEMVSLGAIEDTLLKSFAHKESSEGPILAVCAEEKEEQPRLVVFATFTFDAKAANQILMNAGFSRLIKIAEVRCVKEIPIMGTGKINYRALEKLL